MTQQSQCEHLSFTPRDLTISYLEIPEQLEAHTEKLRLGLNRYNLNMMDADTHFRGSIKHLGYSSLADISQSTIVDLALRFAIWPAISTYHDAPWLAPFAIRRVRRRTEPNAPGPKRDLWGLPTKDGYFTDDNSLIKSLALRRPLSPNNPYGNSVITRGLVCCHIWSGTTTSPLLFSFVPNLVWLPKSLAPLSDAHSASVPHPVHHALKQVSRERYGLIHTNNRVAKAWQLLGPPPLQLLTPQVNTELADCGKIATLAKQRIDRMIYFLETLDSGHEKPERFSKRYHAGVGRGIDKSVRPLQTSTSKTVRRSLVAEMRKCL